MNRQEARALLRFFLDSGRVIEEMTPAEREAIQFISGQSRLPPRTPQENQSAPLPPYFPPVRKPSNMPVSFLDMEDFDLPDEGLESDMADFGDQ